MQCFLDRTGNWQGECKKVAESLHKFGILIVRDPRVDHSDNDTYIDMMEKLTRGGKLKSSKLLSLGENTLSNPSLIRVALHKDKHKVSENIWKKCVAYKKRHKEVQQWHENTQTLQTITT